VRKILFTGSTETGRSIMKAAAGTLKNLSLELGGNDPAVVLESATISDDLVTELMLGTFAISGQVCFSVKRIYVHRSHWATLVEKYCDAVDRLVVGNGLDPSVSMGPLNNRRQYERVQGLLADARERGAEVRALGRKADEASWSEGYFLLPHVVTGLPDSAPLVAEEQFGPAVPIIAFDHDDEAVAAANATEFGLAASVWSDDDAHAMAVARRLQCGTVFRNVHRAGASDMTMPFGGVKQSGIGRMHGVPALEACTESQIVANYQDVTHLSRPPWAGD
jgi:aldehyde dehydrogenase